ncbi:MAG: ABC exporter membrane fusion protein [Scytolyngbya sp. HA4215-MV1]|jgi:HlyD family secretion protein|nr:ABC exporter membrane fusion protein [Scytolyngbya sp. HA4215-MV1]
MLQGSLVSISQAKSRPWVGMAAAVLVLVGGGVGYGVWRSQMAQQAAKQAALVSPPKITTVTALGRLEPQGEVIKLSAPTSSSGNRVEQLLVQEGDRVKAGQVIAILDSRDRLQAAYEQAQEAVSVAQAKLAITQAGAKQGEINAQQAEIARLAAQQQGDLNAQVATVARLTSELQNAETEFSRYQSLYQAGAISASNLDSKRLVLDSAQKSVQEAQAVLARLQATSPAALSQARANLERIAEVRPVDIQASQAEVDRALAAMKQAKAELDQAYVRSPITGEVLAIHTRAGELVANDGIADMGKTQQMNAIAEVYQSDVHRVQVGQRVRVTSDSLPGELVGTVERIDAQVKRQTIVNTDPSTNIDSRIVEVHIALDQKSSQKAAKYTNLQVTVVIQQ